MPKARAAGACPTSRNWPVWQTAAATIQIQPLIPMRFPEHQAIGSGPVRPMRAMLATPGSSVSATSTASTASPAATTSMSAWCGSGVAVVFGWRTRQCLGAKRFGVFRWHCYRLAPLHWPGSFAGIEVYRSNRPVAPVPLAQAAINLESWQLHPIRCWASIAE